MYEHPRYILRISNLEVRPELQLAITTNVNESMPEPNPSVLLGMDRDQLASLVEEAGESSYRAQQIMEAVYRQRVGSVKEISTLPQKFRETLAENGISVGLPGVEKSLSRSTEPFVISLRLLRTKAWRRCGCPRVTAASRAMEARPAS